MTEEYRRWRRVLSSSSPTVSWDLIRQATTFGELALEPLLYLSDDEDEQVRHASCVAMAAILLKPENLLPSSRAILRGAFADRLDSPSESERIFAREQLRIDLSSEMATASAIFPGLADADPAVRDQTIHRLSALPCSLLAKAFRLSCGTPLTDCLGLARVPSPGFAIDSETCVATAAAPTEATELDRFLTQLSVFRDRLKSEIIILAINDDGSCARVSRRHRAILISCETSEDSIAARKALLLSIARIVAASKYICLDVQRYPARSMLSLREALDAVRRETILIVPLPQQPCPPSPASRENALPLGEGEVIRSRYPLLDIGIFAGSDLSLRNLDESIRNIHPFLPTNRHPQTDTVDFIYSLVAGSKEDRMPLRQTYSFRSEGREIS